MKWKLLLLFLVAISSVLAISFTPKGDVDLQNRYTITNINTSTIPVECLLTNSWVSYWGFANSTCRTMNYSAVIGYTYPSLAGAGNAVLCVDTNGLIYRGNATGCP